MRYLVTSPVLTPFLTEWFVPENHYNPVIEMTVYDLVEKKYTNDGVNWIDLEVDHL